VIADYIYRSSPRPVPVIALLGALALMAGICGRAYNVSGMGLNLYLMLLAGTGRGKDAMASGIDRLMAAITEDELNSEGIMGFIGPSHIASGPALRKDLDSSPTKCFLAILGEFGQQLKQLDHPKANAADISLKKEILSIYSKSGYGHKVGKSAYADQNRNMKAVKSPAISILAEGASETIFNVIDETAIKEGLLSRFLMVEYDGLLNMTDCAFH
jgi:hypothetical protein